MKKLQKITLLLLLLFIAVGKTNAQDNNTVLVPPVENKAKAAPADGVIITITSNCDNLIMSHSAGVEKGVRSIESNGHYKYTIEYTFPEDYDDDFMKTQLQLRLPMGQETVPLTMYKGKVYEGKYNERINIAVNREKDAVYPYAKVAKVTFMSAFTNLTISCNGVVCFDNGNPVPLSNCNMKASTETIGEQKDYAIVFNLAPETKSKNDVTGNAVFEISSSDFSSVEVKQDELVGRTSYLFMVVKANSETYEEVLAIAQEKEAGYEKETTSAFFAAVADAYEAASKHLHCPVDKKEAHQIHANKFKKIRNHTNAINQADERWRKVAADEGFESPNVWKYLNFERKRLRALVEEFPEMEYYSKLLSEIDAEYMKHPSSTVEYPVIKGTVSAGDGWIFPVDIDIYASNVYIDGIGGVKKHNLKKVGTVQGGKYSITLREKCKYLYFQGESRSHSIEYVTQTLDVELVP